MEPTTAEAGNVVLLPTSSRRKDFIKRHDLSPRTYDVMRKQGRGPRETVMGGVIRILHADELEWIERMRAEADEQRAALAERNRQSGIKTLASPKHPGHVPARRRA